MFISDTYITVKAANSIANICAPLKKLGVIYCHYSKVYDDGSVALLVSNSEWHKHVFKKEKPGPWPTKTAQIKSGFYSWQPIYDAELVKDAFSHFGIIDGILYVKKEAAYYEIFSFGLNRANYSIINFILNNKDFVEKFAIYFGKKVAEFFKVAENNRLILPSTMTENSYLNDNQDLLLNENIKQEIFQQMALNGQQIPQFTGREIDCLAHISRGRTAKETAKILNISVRTVETYLANAKIKTGCSSKSQLADIFLTFY